MWTRYTRVRVHTARRQFTVQFITSLHLCRVGSRHSYHFIIHKLKTGRKGDPILSKLSPFNKRWFLIVSVQQNLKTSQRTSNGGLCHKSGSTISTNFGFVGSIWQGKVLSSMMWIAPLRTHSLSDHSSIRHDLGGGGAIEWFVYAIHPVHSVHFLHSGYVNSATVHMIKQSQLMS